MITWLVIVPGVLVLLALAGANWRVFSLAYCRSLLRSEDRDRQGRGLRIIHEQGLLAGADFDRATDLLDAVPWSCCEEPEGSGKWLLRFEAGEHSLTVFLLDERAAAGAGDRFPAGRVVGTDYRHTVPLRTLGAPKSARPTQ
jgi:hypothetical protein